MNFTRFQYDCAKFQEDEIEIHTLKERNQIRKERKVNL